MRRCRRLAVGSLCMTSPELKPACQHRDSQHSEEGQVCSGEPALSRFHDPISERDQGERPQHHPAQPSDYAAKRHSFMVLRHCNISLCIKTSHPGPQWYFRCDQPSSIVDVGSPSSSFARSW
ncbi:MAG: hypothetical protein FJ271_09080 [Planctomycetes bacterium]|nr:hypothetical protein [Planctomycetota bacterium]